MIKPGTHKMQEGEAGEFLRVQGHPALQSKTLSQKKKKIHTT